MRYISGAKKIDKSYTCKTKRNQQKKMYAHNTWNCLEAIKKEQSLCCAAPFFSLQRISMQTNPQIMRNYCKLLQQQYQNKEALCWKWTENKKKTSHDFVVPCALWTKRLGWCMPNVAHQQSFLSYIHVRSKYLFIYAFFVVPVLLESLVKLA